MENNQVKEQKKFGLFSYVIITILAIAVITTGVEAYAAISEGRSMNVEIIIKVLDTATSLLGSTSVD